MSGRYGLFDWPQQWHELPGFPDDPVQRWSISPRQPVLLLYQRANQRRAGQALWGFTPRWSSSLERVTTHARCEGLTEQKLFAQALATQRGVLPANGFYEWRGKPGTAKQPYWLSRPGEMLYMAALWEPYAVAGAEYLSVAMLTVQAAYLRRPMLLTEADLEGWMDPATPLEQALALLERPSLPVQERKVSVRVNDPRHDDPDCIRPLAAREWGG